MLQLRLLGSVELVEANGTSVKLGRRQERCVLGLLAMEAGRAVTLERLVQLVWQDDPPVSARASLHSHISRLRRRLSTFDIAIVSKGSAYAVHADPLRIDVHLFTAKLVQAQQEPDPVTRVDLLTQALALWRGPLLADAADEHLRARLGAGLEDKYLLAHELLVDAELANGSYRQTAARLQELLTRYPGRERLAGQLIRARYQCGDVAGALAAYDTIRTYLAAELGLDPSTELTDLHQAILNRQEPQRTATQHVTRPVPWQLPPDIGNFVGRHTELSQLNCLLSHDGTAAIPAIVISAIAGTAGVGKTALAIRWARTLSRRDPDGTLHVDLRGFGPSAHAMDPEQAICVVLDALGVPVQHLPATLHAKTGLYRSLLHDRKMIIFLDNARDADQVRPLLPNSPGCLVVITSRYQLYSLMADGAHPLTLGLLTHHEARQLIAQRIGQAKVAAQPQAVDDIISSCARLPLALALVTAYAAAHPHLSLTHLAAELQSPDHVLHSLHNYDVSANISAVFSWSYRALSPHAAQLFRLCGLHPAPTQSTTAAASLCGRSIKGTQALLAELLRANLITEPAPGHFALHDLLHAYARHLTNIEARPGNDLATHRMLDHYLATAHHADLLLDPHRDPITIITPTRHVSLPELSTHDAALQWFQQQHFTLLRITESAGLLGCYTHQWQLAWSLGNFLERQGHWRQWREIQQLGLAAAAQLDDQPAQARIHRSLARAHARLTNYPRAETHLHQALKIYTAIGDPVGQAYSHLNVNVILNEQQRYHEALPSAQTALALFERAGHRVGQALSLNAIGWNRTQTGDHQAALLFCHKALDIHRCINHPAGEADTLDSIAHAHHGLGANQHASSAYHQALDLFQQLGDRYNQAMTHLKLSGIASDTSHPDQAQHHRHAALVILQELNHPDTNRAQTLPWT